MTAKPTPLVSVVTPAYNEQEHIAECIESVLAQTHANWEFTIVNNCSTDRTLEIARSYAQRDPRIRVHCNESTVPVIANYNTAFRQVSSESRYCKVVAADDWIYPECLERMVNLAEANPNVSIVGAHTRLGNKVEPHIFPYAANVVSGRKVCRDWLLGGPYLFGAATSLLFRADIVRSRDAFYREPQLFADTEACLEFLENHDFGFVQQVLTFTRVRDLSLTAQFKDIKLYFPNILHFLKTYGPKYLDDQELAHEISEQLWQYYEFLGSQIYQRRGPEFWQTHQQRLAELGHPLSRTRLYRHAFAYGIGWGVRKIHRRL